MKKDKTLTPYELLKLKKRLAELNEFISKERAERRKEKFRERENRKEINGYYKHIGKLSEKKALDEQKQNGSQTEQNAEQSSSQETE